MNQQQAGFAPYPSQPPHHGFAYTYSYAQPTSQPPQVAYPFHQAPTPNPQRQPAQYAPPLRAPPQNAAHGIAHAQALNPPQFRPVLPSVTSSSPPIAELGASAGAAPASHVPDDHHHDEDDVNGQPQQYGPNGSDENGAIFNIPPPPEANYPNEEELEKAIHAWSKEHGYELVRRASKRSAAGVLYKRYYHCSKHGAPANTSKLTDDTRQRVNRKSGRVGCPMSLAAVAVDPDDPSGEWQIRHRKNHHNHGPLKAVELAGHRRRARTAAVEQAIDALFAMGTSTANVLGFLQRSHPDCLFTRNDVANMKTRFKKWGTCADRIQRGENHISTVRYKNQLGIPIPCIPCRQRKFNCGSERPTCKNCQQNGFQCEYSHDQPVQNGENTPEHADSMQIDLSPQPQTQPAVEDIGPTTPSISRGRPQPPPTAEQTEQILNSLKNYQAEYITPQRLNLDSSSVEVLAQSSCGNGDSYRGLPFLNSERDWPAFRDAMIEATLKENTHDVLTGLKTEPIKPTTGATSDAAAVDIETWNEYIKQLAIYNRRNSLLLSAMLSKTSPMFRNRIQTFQHATPAWRTLEGMCEPRGSEAAWNLYCELHAITLATSASLQNYISRLESTYAQIKQLKVNTSALGQGKGRGKPAEPTLQGLAHNGAEAMTEEMVVFLFLRGLGPEWARWSDVLCATSNVGGFGTGERVGFREVCKAALRQEALARRGGG